MPETSENQKSKVGGQRSEVRRQRSVFWKSAILAGYTFSAKGATLKSAWGNAPGSMAHKTRPAPKARFTSKPVRFWSREVIHRVEPRLQRLVTDVQSRPGAMPQACI